MPRSARLSTPNTSRQWASPRHRGARYKSGAPFLRPRYEISLDGRTVATASYSRAMSRLRLEFPNNQVMDFRRTKLFWTMTAGSDYGSVGINLDGICSPTGEKMWKMDHREAKSLGKLVEQTRPTQAKGLRRPTDPSVGHGSDEKPFYMQWSLVLPNALRSSNELIASMVILIGFRWFVTVDVQVPSAARIAPCPVRLSVIPIITRGVLLRANQGHRRQRS